MLGRDEHDSQALATDGSWWWRERWWWLLGGKGQHEEEVGFLSCGRRGDLTCLKVALRPAREHPAAKDGQSNSCGKKEGRKGRKEGREENNNILFLISGSASRCLPSL